mgnify:CR=1 FL=1|jgi:hypothetical protein
MSKGCLIVAFNNKDIDYVKLANYSVKNIQRHLGVSTTLITDQEVKFKHNFDQIIIVDKPNSSPRNFRDLDKAVNWINFNRYQAFDFTPYDQTILLDADYIVASNQLSILFKLDRSFLCHRHSYDIASLNPTLPNTFGLYKMPMDWATVIYFKKDKVAENIFNTIKMVQDNYSHYALLYNFNNRPFRNDYALSIALNINNGHFNNINDYYIPWDLVYVDPRHDIKRMDSDTYQVNYSREVNKKSMLYRVIVKDQDLHVMGKSYLKKLYED